MSSILDALKKLEAEKAEARNAADSSFAEDSAERELVGKNPLRERVTIRLSPVTILLGFAAAVLVLAGISVAVTLTVLSRTGGLHASAPPRPAVPAVVDAPRPQPAPPAFTEDQTPLAAVAAAPAAADAPVPEDAGAIPAAAPSPEEAPAPAPADEPPDEAAVLATAIVPPPAPPAAIPAIVPIEKAPEPDENAAPPESSIAAASWQSPMIDAAHTSAPIKKLAPAPDKPSAAPSPEEIAELAKRPLRESDRVRLGLARLQINLLQPATKNRPHASAIINLNQVYVGETIPRTDAKLIALDGVKGIVIALQQTGERFYVAF